MRAESPIPLDLAFNVAAGEVFALVGPSGSGKSTVLRSIAGLYRPASGHVACGGTIWMNSDGQVFWPARRRSIGLVFQSYALFPHLTALENLFVAMSRQSARTSRERAQKLLEDLHLGGLHGRYPHELSGGQQQRVAVARALARDPSVLLLDEPFSAVDRPTRIALQRELSNLCRELTIPVILVTHDLDEAVRLAQRIAVLDAGRVLQEGTPAEITTRPTSARVARLTGTVNLFEGIRRPGSQAAQVLQWGDLNFVCDQIASVPEGAKVDWCIAPEHIELHAGSVNPGLNTIVGTVRSVRDFGAIREVIVSPESAGAGELVSRMPATAATFAAQPGQEVALHFPQQRIYVMAAKERERQTGGILA